MTASDKCTNLIKMSCYAGAIHTSRSVFFLEWPLCLRFFDAGLSVISPLGATVARVGKHD
jgi:hypothetical protein